MNDEKPIRPLDLLHMSEEKLSELGAQGRIKIHRVIPGDDGIDYIEVVEPQ